MARNPTPAVKTSPDVAIAADHSSDPLMVQSVEKAFRVLAAFDEERSTMNLAQVVAATGLDKSGAQRFTHTLTRLGYLHKDPETKRFELTPKTLGLGYHYTLASRLVGKAFPYLLHLSKTTEETVNLTVRDDTDIVIVSRFMSRHVLNNDVIVGMRLPAYCTASGIAMLSRLPLDEARDVLRRSDLKAHTPKTTHRLKDLTAKLEVSAKRGYATVFEEYYHGDLSVAAAIIDPKGRPIGAINLAVSGARYTPDEIEERFAPLVIAAALSVSQMPKSRR